MVVKVVKERSERVRNLLGTEVRGLLLMNIMRVLLCVWVCCWVYNGIRARWGCEVWGQWLGCGCGE